MLSGSNVCYVATFSCAAWWCSESAWREGPGLVHIERTAESSRVSTFLLECLLEIILVTVCRESVYELKEERSNARDLIIATSQEAGLLRSAVKEACSLLCSLTRDTRELLPQNKVGHPPVDCSYIVTMYYFHCTE